MPNVLTSADLRGVDRCRPTVSLGMESVSRTASVSHTVESPVSWAALGPASSLSSLRSRNRR